MFLMLLVNKLDEKTAEIYGYALIFFVADYFIYYCN